jgi:hypothetical protein
MVSLRRVTLALLASALLLPAGVHVGASLGMQQALQSGLAPSPVQFVVPDELLDVNTNQRPVAGQQTTLSLCNPAPANVNDLCRGGNPSGGQGPYHFQIDTMGGFPPMGLTLHPNGLLTGTPKTNGPISFRVCAVDLSGYQNCQDVKMNVQPKTANSAKKSQEKQKQARTGSKSPPTKLVAIGAIAAGGALGAAYASKLSTTGGCDTSSAPVNEIYTYCFGATRNTTQCNYYIGEYDKFCKSCGFSGFDAGTGSCK